MVLPRPTSSASWGRYATAKSDVQLTEQGKPRTVWRRTPAGGTVELDLLSANDTPVVVDAGQEQVVLRATVRVRDDARVVDLALVNDQGIPNGNPDVARTYQTTLTVTALDGAAAVFLGHNDPELSENPAASDAERLHLSLLYRDRREFAHGRQCAVDAEVRAGENRAWRLRTTSFPAADVPLTVAGSTDSMPGLILDMARLGSPELARDDLVRALRPLATGYRAWLAAQQSRLDDPEIRRYEPAGSHALTLAVSLADRLDRAVDLLREDGVAREAFRFANQAMAMQRVRSEVTRARLASPETPLEDLLQRYGVPKHASWYPFQLAFVLLCLSGLTDPQHVDAHRDEVGQAQLLFFPTGGGKTEAYLGLTAFTLALRRLQGVVGQGADARNGSDGVGVLMRYTLRLLTAQQFQRAAALMCACEELRRERLAPHPRHLGLVVGHPGRPGGEPVEQRLGRRSLQRDGTGGGIRQRPDV